MATRYFVRRDLTSDKVLELARVVDEPRAPSGACWRGGQWIDHPSALKYLLSGEADEISKAEADRLVEELKALIARGPT